jgi:hypothetical protein
VGVILKDFSPEGSGAHCTIVVKVSSAPRQILRKLRMTQQRGGEIQILIGDVFGRGKKFRATALTEADQERRITRNHQKYQPLYPPAWKCLPQNSPGSVAR